MINCYLENRNKIKRIIGGIFFVFLAVIFFAGITFLFRNKGYDRNHIVGIKNEKNNIDVIYIGGSAAFVYWEPLKAYKDYGFTSYNLATNAMGVENILPYIKYSEKYQNPQLFIIDLRPFQYYSDEPNEQGVRNGSDGMDITTLARYELINSYFYNRNIGDNNQIVSYYIDIMKYHTNYDNLSSKLAWRFITNSGKSQFKGCELPKKWVHIDEPVNYKTEDRKELLPNARKELHKILDYLDKNRINALFVVCPYCLDKEHYSIYNTISDEVVNRGYSYINLNDYYDEIGIDFATDFYNISHVNAYGAEKYTSFLEKYIFLNYNLPDHRGNQDYYAWDISVGEFDDYSYQVKLSIDAIKSRADSAVLKKQLISNTDDLTKWSTLVNDSDYSLFVVGDGTLLSTCSDTDIESLERLKIDTNKMFSSDNYIDVFADGMFDLAEITEKPPVIDNAMKIPFGKVHKKNEAIINNNDNACSITVGGEETSRKDKEGVNIVVLENHYRNIIDSVTLKNRDGRIVIER